MEEGIINSNDPLKNTSYKWEIEVYIFKDPIIVRQLGLCIGVPFGALIIMLSIFAAGGDKGAIYALMLVASLFVLTYAFIMIVYRGKYAAGFIIDKKGILNYTQKKQAKKNRIINSLTVFLGLVSGRYSAAGAGVLAQSRQSVLVRWNRIRKVKYYPKRRTILVKGGFAETIAVFCNDENYEDISALIGKKVKLLNRSE